jgi:hypothetical protein
MVGSRQAAGRQQAGSRQAAGRQQASSRQAGRKTKRQTDSKAGRREGRKE